MNKWDILYLSLIHIYALGVGPGLGQNETTALALIAQLRRATWPLVIDADALNILSSHRAWMQQLPKNIIMTPHPKEFDVVQVSYVSL